MKYGISNWGRTRKFATLSIMFLQFFAPQAHGQNSNISFDDILRNPNNIELNLQYAKNKAADDNVLSALGALERIILENPERDDVRLYYASLLLRIDDLQAARGEIHILEQRQLSSPQMQELAQLQKQAGLTPKEGTDGFSGQLALGVQYDSNAGNLFKDAPFLTIANGDDIAAFGQGSLIFKKQLSSQFAFHAGVDGQITRHETYSRVDYDTVSGFVGIKAALIGMNWKLDGVFDQVYIDNKKYLTQYGPRLDFIKSFGSGWKLVGQGLYLDQQFENTQFTPFEYLRSGGYVAGQLGIIKEFSRTTSLGLYAGYGDKDADFSTYKYDEFFVGGDFNHRFVNNMYAKTGANYRQQDYDANNQDDKLINAYGVFGIPFSAIKQNLKIELGVNYTQREFGYTGLDFDNVGLNSRLVWDF